MTMSEAIHGLRAKLGPSRYVCVTLNAHWHTGRDEPRAEWVIYDGQTSRMGNSLAAVYLATMDANAEPSADIDAAEDLAVSVSTADVLADEKPPF